MRGTTRHSITVKGRARSVMVERRPIAGPELAQDGRGDVSTYADDPEPSAPVCERPIASEVAAALSARPLRFPVEWFRGGER